MTALLQAVGFVAIRVGPQRYDTFSGAPSASSAAEYGTRGINLFALKPRRGEVPAGPAIDGVAATPGLLRTEPAPAAPPPIPSGRYGAVALLDAGDEHCTTLSGTLRRRLRALAPGQVLEVRSTEPSARVDVPAWCGLTGHTLLAMEDQGASTVFFIRRKEE